MDEWRNKHLSPDTPDLRCSHRAGGRGRQRSYGGSPGSSIWGLGLSPNTGPRVLGDLGQVTNFSVGVIKANKTKLWLFNLCHQNSPKGLALIKIRTQWIFWTWYSCFDVPFFFLLLCFMSRGLENWTQSLGPCWQTACHLLFASFRALRTS